MLFTAIDSLSCEIALLARAVGVTLTQAPPPDQASAPVEPSPGGAGGYGLGPCLVLVGPDVDASTVPYAESLIRLTLDGLPLSPTPHPAETIALPDGRDRLIELLAEAANPPRGPVVGVIGTAGGAGTTTLSVALVARAHRQARGAQPDAGLPAVLLDLDPASPGLDTLLDGPPEQGLHWADLRGLDSPLVATPLGHVLPSWHDVPYLTRHVIRGDGGPEPNAEAVRAVVRWARSQARLTVLDLGRGTAHAPWHWLTATVLVVPADVAGVVSAGRYLARLDGPPTHAQTRPHGSRRVGVVVRRSGNRGAGLSTAEVNAALRGWQLEVVAEVGDVRGLKGASDQGRLHHMLTGAGLATTVGCLLDWIRL